MAELYRVRVEWSGLVQGGGLTQLYFEGASGTATNATDAVISGLSQLLPLMSNKCTYTVDSAVDVIESTTGQITGQNTGTSITKSGIQTGDQLPPATQGLVSWRTGAYVNGRQVVGKMYVPGFTEDSSAAGVPTSQARDAMVAMANGFSPVGGISHAVYSRTHKLFFTQNTFTAWNKWAVLRSRRD